MTATEAPPRWDLTPIFAGVDDRAFTDALEGVYARVDRLGALYDELDIRDTARREVKDADVAALEAVLHATNELQSELRPVSTYLYALISTDSRNDLAAARHVELQTRGASLASLAKRLGAWLAALGTEELIARSPIAAEHAFLVRKASEGAELQMSEQEESLAGELAPSGSLAWQRLHGDVSSQLMVELRDSQGELERVPMAFARGLAMHADPARRRAAYEGELAAWATVAVPLAAALNGAKGELGVLNRRRGFPDDLEPALRANNVDRATLDAMTGAVVASLPDFRRYLRAKARLLGHDGGLPWWDLFAPVGRPPASSGRMRPDRVRDAFAGFSPDLVGLANRAFAENWIDAETREGKQGGAYCAGVAGDVSRVMMNFDGSQDSVSTLAHELGHAFHNVVLAPRTPMQRRLPMALAETASIFCETLLFEHAAGGRHRRRRAAGPARRAPRRRDADGRRHSQPVPVRDRAVRAPAPHGVVGRRHADRDARRPGGRVRRRSASRLPPRVHVGGQGPLLHAVLQLAVHVRVALRHRALRATSTIPTRSAPATTTCSRRSAWPTRPRWRAGSASTFATASSGPRASPCSGATSTTTSFFARPALASNSSSASAHIELGGRR